MALGTPSSINTAETITEVAVIDSSQVLRYRGRVNDQVRLGGARPEASRHDLREIERLQKAAIAYDPAFVRKTYSIVDILKDLNQAFHGGDPAYYEIPESRELVAQVYARDLQWFGYRFEGGWAPTPWLPESGRPAIGKAPE